MLNETEYLRLLRHHTGTMTVQPAMHADRASAETAAARVRRHLMADRSVLAVKADHVFRNGARTDDFGVTVIVAPGCATDPARYDLGRRLDGIAISVETEVPRTTAKRRFTFGTAAERQSLAS
jgi:hypothetical protein